MDIRALIITCCYFGLVTSRSDVQRSGRRRKLRDDRNGFCELELNCQGRDPHMDNFSMPVRGPKGPQGYKGEKGDHGEDGLPGSPGIPGLSAPLPKKVAFFAGLSENMGPVKEHTDIVFDRVITNVGAGYDTDRGHFVAPVNGTYHFNVVVSAQGRQKAAVMLIKNGAMICTVWAESIPYWATASNVAILSLDKGDNVWLMLLNRASYLHGFMYTTFSGYLIFEQ